MHPETMQVKKKAMFRSCFIMCFGFFLIAVNLPLEGYPIFLFGLATSLHNIFSFLQDGDYGEF